MRTTLIKTKHFHLWVSGSMVEPYSNIWFNSKRSENGYKGLNIFPYLWISKAYTVESGYTRARGYLRYGMSNSTPKLLQWWLKMKSGYRSFCYFNWDHDNQIKYQDPTFIGWIIKTLKIEYLQKHCNHDYQFESHITPDHGSEDVYCPKCGLSHHVTYY
jgi:hypothetical protein